MVKGVGLDVTLVSRMEKALETKGFLERIFTEDERIYLASKGNAARSAAGLFSAKEATLKAMGKGVRDVPLREIRILHDDSGAPRASWRELEFMLSITHMGDVAAAVALWQDC